MRITATTGNTLTVTETGRPTTPELLEHLNRGLNAAFVAGTCASDETDAIYYQHSFTMTPMRVALLVYSAVLHHAFGRQRTIFVDLDGSEHVIDDSGEPYPRTIGNCMTVEVRMDEPLWDEDHLVSVPGFYIVILFPKTITEAQYNNLVRGIPATLDASLFDNGHHRQRIDYLTDLTITTPYEVAATVGDYVAKHFGFEGYLLVMLNDTTRYVTIGDSPPSP